MFGLFSFMDDIVDSVIGQIMSQVNVLSDQIESPFKAMIQQVTGGAWQGNGADQFVEEMNSVVLPMVVQLIASLAGAGGGGSGGGFIDGLNFARQVINEVDDAVNSIVNGLGDIFDSIF